MCVFEALLAVLTTQCCTQSMHTLFKSCQDKTVVSCSYHRLCMTYKISCLHSLDFEPTSLPGRCANCYVLLLRFPVYYWILPINYYFTIT